MQRISIFDERVRGNYNQGSQFFKLTNFFENSSDLETELRRRDIAPKKPTFCSLPYFKTEENDVIAACYVLNKNEGNKLIALKSADLAIKDLNQKYNIPIFWQITQDTIIYPTCEFKKGEECKKENNPFGANTYSIEENADLIEISIDDLKIKNIYKIRESLEKNSNITALKKYENFIRKSQPIFLKYFHLLIYAYENLPFFFVSTAPEFSIEGSKQDEQWKIYIINYDGAKIQQIIEIHGYIFIFLKDKAVVYTLGSGQDDGTFADITEASGQNLPIGTDNTFSVIKHLNKVITLYNSSIYTVSQFQPTKISTPTVDSWLAKSRNSSIALMTLKEGSFDFLYAINTDENEAWIMNLHNETWSFSNLEGIAYKDAAYSGNQNARYINILGQLCSYRNSLSKEGEYVIETGLISLESKVYSVNEIIISFDSLPESTLQLVIEYKLIGNDTWHEGDRINEIDQRTLKIGNVLHRRLKIRSSQFALRLTFKSLEDSAKPLIVQDVLLCVV